MSAPKLILIVDDYDHVARFLARLVEVTTAFNAISALDGETALRLARERRPDAVLVAVDMVGLDGPETARALRGLFPERPPVLIGMSQDASFAASATSDPFDFLLVKPFELAQLLPLLNFA